MPGSGKPRTDSESATTRPDPLDRPQESPSAALGDAWRLLAYLLPVLSLVVLAIRGLKAVYTRTGGQPRMRDGLLGGLNLVNARKTAGSSIKVLESVPVGPIGLHLIEVRGRLLLIGAAGGSVSVLTEIKPESRPQDGDFSSLLTAAASGLESESVPVGAVVGSLDDSMRQAKESILAGAARMRRWNQQDA